jgi:hypothetical protein
MDLEKPIHSGGAEIKNLATDEHGLGDRQKEGHFYKLVSKKKQIPRIRSGFRLRAQTPANRLN